MAKLNIKMITGILTVVVLIIMLFTILAETSGDVGNVADNFTATNGSHCNGVEGSDCPSAVYPLASFLKRNGLVLLMFIVGIVLVVAKGVMPSKK